MHTINLQPPKAASKTASFAKEGGTKVNATSAFVSETASLIVSKIGIPSTFSPPFPGLVPATTFVP